MGAGTGSLFSLGSKRLPITTSIPLSHMTPVTLTGQRHVKKFKPSSHVPPFWQGFEAHSSGSVKRTGRSSCIIDTKTLEWRYINAMASQITGKSTKLTACSRVNKGGNIKSPYYWPFVRWIQRLRLVDLRSARRPLTPIGRSGGPYHVTTPFYHYMCVCAFIFIRPCHN